MFMVRISMVFMLDRQERIHGIDTKTTKQHSIWEKIGNIIRIGLLSPLFNHLRDISRDESLELEFNIAIALKQSKFIMKGGH